MRPWLESLEPGELDGWIAYYKLEPWDRPQQTTAPSPQPEGQRMVSIKEAALKANGLA